MKKSITICIMLATAMVAFSCKGPEVEPAKNYIKLDDPLYPYDFSSVSSDNSRIAVTEREIFPVENLFFDSRHIQDPDTFNII